MKTIENVSDSGRDADRSLDDAIPMEVENIHASTCHILLDTSTHSADI